MTARLSASTARASATLFRPLRSSALTDRVGSDARPWRGPFRDTVRGMWRIVVVGAVTAVIVAGSIVLRRPLRRRWFAGTGLAEWQATAQRLSWRDRMRLERANSRGRAASPELAALAVQRGRTMVAIVEHWQTMPVMRRTFPAFAAVLLVILSAARLLTGDTSRSAWSSVVGWTVMAATYAAMPSLQRRQLRKFRRSVELNEALLERGPTSGSL